MAKSGERFRQQSQIRQTKPDDTQGGTYTVTNVGTFGSVWNANHQPATV
jgi:2-oxoglutarate dehydrogenase E2 component (dihydrolipoamide succinyltransferase)